ncbi:Chromosome transmission fidelity protein 18 [Sesamum alatum]|uniref:Chromosome transmission fidelity protein 18 homolog n=1 Tax=Sesamum alatum TaxID=300844 RepID=A0AAE1Y1V4_9LAMI|nr:Chromosome transmission fidelity protein 18 [Sesamum alatum]
MDIPDLEELEWLEWLESHTLNDPLEDDYELEIGPPSSPETDNPPDRSSLSLPPKPSPFKPKTQINPTIKKRVQSDLPKSILLDVDNNYDFDENGPYAKRSRTEEAEIRKEKSAQSKSPDVAPVVGDDKSGGVNGPSVLLNGNVGSVENNEGSGGDEEWLRYSPPRDIVEEMETQREERILSRYATEIEGDCVPVTGLDGERVYAKICRVDMDEVDRKKTLSARGDFNGLLQEPVRVLMQKVEHEEFAKALQASAEGPTEVVPLKATVTDQQLWVDKYAPSSFTELLSDEQTNREWDSCVFGSEIMSTTDDVLSALRRHSSGSQHSKQSSKSYFANNKETRLSRNTLGVRNDLNKENSISQGIQDMRENRHKSFGPPEQKILLLCGPPGLGKTTLAHVAARHCGYRVVEINASDDRSSSTIEAKILDVLQMNSVIADSKPKCLVIDEIDGALGEGKGAVEVILQLVLADRKSDTGKENVDQEAHSGRKSSHKKQRNSPLLRPVICICNDLYAPALRQLRQVAKVHIFVQPTVSRVVNRLKYICNKEGVKTSSIALSALAEYTECDIRSCLNTLQFLNKKKEILNVLEISSQVVGRKDTSKSAFDIWKEIFHKRKGKRARKSYNSVSSSMSKDFEFLYSMISNRGDYDLILDGIHENILQLRYVDPVMQKTVQCLDNLVVSDITHRYIMRTQQMSLQVYQPPIAIIIHGLIAQLEKKDIEWPKSFQRHRTMLAERMDMFHTWHNRILPYISRHLSTKSFVEDSISPMLYILSPPTLRPVALHLLSDNEKTDIGQLVNSMVSYAITYKSIKSDRGSLRHEDALDATALSLDPPLGEFIQFKGYNSCHVDLALAVKQVLVHEVEKQKILQGSVSKSTHLHAKENHAPAKDNSGSGLSSKSSYKNGSEEKKMDREILTADKSGLSVSCNTPVAESSGYSTSIDGAKSVQTTKKPSGGPANFFDRFRKVSNADSRITTNVVHRPGTAQRDSHPLLFKFNEGFTNAVKRPVRVREFLL